MSPALQIVFGACGVVSTLGTVTAAIVVLKIREQISVLEARLLARLAEQYVTKDDLQMVLTSGQSTPHVGRKAAHA